MPSISEIIDSTLIPALIQDEVIKDGKFDKNGNELIFYTGGFTVVFPVTTQNDKWAFRCWHTEMGNVRKRFKIISDFINDLHSTYFCNFYYCDSGIVVDGKLFPTTRMQWVDGLTLNEYLIKNSTNKEKLLILADKFLTMVEFLHQHHIAHGDLQHGNIIIEDEDIKLVDYDSLFVPGMDGFNDIITGKPEFQHPKRPKLKIANEKLDYFSELVIYLSILAIAYSPSILNDYSIEDSLLFKSGDWEDFKNTSIYNALKAIGNDDITLLVDVLADYLNEEDINNLIPFSIIWKNLKKEPVIHSFSCGNVDGIVFRGKETTISWVAENMSRVELDSIELSPEQNTFEMTFSDDTDISLVIRNGLHCIKQTKHVKVIDAPTISFSVEKKKLKRKGNNIETTKLRWSTSNAKSLVLKQGNTVVSTAKASTGFTIAPKIDTVYVLVVVGLDGRTEFSSQVKVVIRDQAKFDFYSDKLFTLPGVPVTITWSVKYAKHVKINGAEVPLQGNSIFYPKCDEKYTITVKDAFGEVNKTINVRMLPLPVVTAVVVETPNLCQTINVQQNTPKFESSIHIPTITSDLIKIDVPAIPDLQRLDCFVNLKSVKKSKLSNRISQFIKNIFK